MVVNVNCDGLPVPVLKGFQFSPYTFFTIQFSLHNERFDELHHELLSSARDNSSSAQVFLVVERKKSSFVIKTVKKSLSLNSPLKPRSLSIMGPVPLLNLKYLAFTQPYIVLVWPYCTQLAPWVTTCIANMKKCLWARSKNVADFPVMLVSTTSDFSLSMMTSVESKNQQATLLLRVHQSLHCCIVL